MPRRIHTPLLSPGQAEVRLSPAAAHHARDVLRLGTGVEVELFDDAGSVARGTIVTCDPRDVIVRVDELRPPPPFGGGFSLTIAAAVPKGDRADWMVEKLSELGVARFIPLAATRSVVLPEGKNKRERWERIATEAAKQSRRAGVMRIDALTGVEDVVSAITSDTGARGWHLSTAPGAVPVAEAVVSLRDPPGGSLVALIGPEGGWTDAELARFADVGLTAVALTPTILRVETAAVATAAVVGSIVAQ